MYAAAIDLVNPALPGASARAYTAAQARILARSGWVVAPPAVSLSSAEPGEPLAALTPSEDAAPVVDAEPPTPKEN